jgi:predicted nuclease with TOPRIM domain
MSKLLSILTKFGIVCATIGTLFGVFKMVDGMQRNYVEQKENVDTIIQSIDELKCDVYVAFDSIRKQIYGVEDRLEGIESQQSSLEGSFRFYRHNVDKVTKEQMEDIIRDAYTLGYQTGKKKEPILY